MDIGGLQTAVDAAWENRTKVTAQTKGETRDAVETALELLDRGTVRVAEKKSGKVGDQSVAEEGGAALLPPQ